MRISEIETPAPVVDLDVLERYLDRMSTYTSQHGLELRPHIKTLTSPRVAAEQLRRGAVGLTCATTHEAEVMADLTGDILVAYPPVGAARVNRLMNLPRTVNLMVALDSAEAIESIAAAAKGANRPVRILIECDLGMHRVGVTTIEEGVRLARMVAERPPLVFAGVNFYPGHIRTARTEQQSSAERLLRRLWNTSM